MRKRVFGGLLIGMGCLLIFSAAGLTVYNIHDDYRAQDAVNSVLEQLSSRENNKPRVNEEVVPDYQLNPNMNMPTVEIDEYQYIGEVSIPSLDLELPVMETWDYNRMKISPCRYSGTAYLKNLVICAHNYVSHFGRLKNLTAGDTVAFTDIDGNVFHYTVSQMETLSSTAVEEMNSGSWDLTLFTCTIGGQARVTVRCTQVKTNGD